MKNTTNVPRQRIYLHPRVSQVVVVVAEQHNLVVVGEVAIGDGDGGRSHDGIDQSIRAM